MLIPFVSSLKADLVVSMRSFCFSDFKKIKKKCKIKSKSLLSIIFLMHRLIKWSVSPPRFSPPTATTLLLDDWCLDELSQGDHHHKWSGESSMSLQIFVLSQPLDRNESTRIGCIRNVHFDCNSSIRIKSVTFSFQFIHLPCIIIFTQHWNDNMASKCK